MKRHKKVSPHSCMHYYTIINIMDLRHIEYNILIEDAEDIVPHLTEEIYIFMHLQERKK